MKVFITFFLYFIYFYSQNRLQNGVQIDARNASALCPRTNQTCVVGIATPYMGVAHRGIVVVNTTHTSYLSWYPKRVSGSGAIGFWASFVVPMMGEVRKDGIVHRAMNNSGIFVAEWVTTVPQQKLVELLHNAPLAYSPVLMGIPYISNCNSWTRMIRSAI
jgi:hypothetical protein